ncbi:alpha/beta hydrolase [SAR202 cluster bacterium AC-647-P02_OGT_505m]|nr:alpha/beta hydrolase [SAR202 cluster bacterium AC-647-P02_OGT_505m]
MLNNKYPLENKVNIGNLELSYRNWAPEGRQILMLHGLASNARIWDLLAPILAKNFSVIAVDQRGHGKSDRPDTGYDFDTVTNDVVGFINALKLKNPIVVGHSWGGSVALCLATQRPDLISGLCFVDGGLIEISRTPGNSLEKALVSMAPPLWEGVSASDVRERLKRRDWGEQDDTSTSANLEEIVMANLETHPDGSINARLSRKNHLEVVKAFWNHKPSKLFEHIRCPTLILSARMGSENTDRQVLKNELLNEAAQKIAINKSMWLENSIHDVPIQRPELLASILTNNIESGFFGE